MLKGVRSQAQLHCDLLPAPNVSSVSILFLMEIGESDIATQTAKMCVFGEIFMASCDAFKLFKK